MGVRPLQCERARAWVSLWADGELSELESALLDTHLAGCGECRSFARDAEELTVVLRGARLERRGAGLRVTETPARAS